MSVIGGLDFAAETIIDEGIDSGLPFFEDAGFRRLDKGVVATSRHAFETDRGTVIKVPQKPHYKETNKDEVKAWQMVQDENLLAPVVDHADDYRWIEMLKCHRVERHHKSVRDEFENKLAQSPYEKPDNHLGNLGIHPESKEVVTFDYPRIKRA